jgi:6-phosphogluconolactonase
MKPRRAIVSRERHLGILMLALAACSGVGDDAAMPDGDVADSAEATGPVIVYVGDYGTNIHVFTLDRETLQLTAVGEATTEGAPSFLAFDPQRRWLIAADETTDAVESFAIAPTTGLLTRVDSAPSQGGGPAHVAVDATGAWALVANYGGGTAAVLPIDAAGSFGAAVATVSPGANAHQIVVDASNQVAYVPCLGDDRVAVYGFDATSGALSARTPAAAPTDSGPRHLALARDGAHAWVMNERDSTVTTYTVGAGGALTAGATVSSLPGDFNGANTGAEIAVHPSGPWVYASNRGHDSIAVFEIGAGGALTRIANTPTGGSTPRHFSLLPGGDAILVANLDSGTIHGFRIDGGTGLLTSVGEVAAVASPAFVGGIVLAP